MVSLSALGLSAQADEVQEQLEAPRLPDPSLRRPRAGREEKRVTHANETIKKRDSIGTEQLDCNEPGQGTSLACSSFVARGGRMRLRTRFR